MGILSKKTMQDANILPRLKLGVQVLDEVTGKKSVKSTGKHYVRLVKESDTTGTDFETRKPIEMIRYVFEENGQQVRYDARKYDKNTGEPHYFVQSMAYVEEGEEIVLEMVKKGIKNVILVQKLGEQKLVEADDIEEDDKPPFES